jgi:hypothetical protein
MTAAMRARPRATRRAILTRLQGRSPETVPVSAFTSMVKRRPFHW